MTHKKSADLKTTAFWREARRRLLLAKPEPPIPLEELERWRKALPARQPEESLEDWLRRVRAAAQIRSGTAPFRAKPRWRFTPLADIKRLAASSGGAEIPLPDPDRALETADGRFRLTLTAGQGLIQVMVETLGLAADTLARRRLGIAGPHGEEELIAIIALNEDGEGCAQVEDRPEVRQALLHPIIGLIEEA